MMERDNYYMHTLFRYKCTFFYNQRKTDEIKKILKMTINEKFIDETDYFTFPCVDS